MKQSQLFTKTSKTAPSDEVSKNAELLIRAGYIHKEMAGVYTLLPLGHKVFNNIVNVIREEMNAIGGQELEMTALQDGAVWQKSGRWVDNPDVDVWFTTKLKNDTELGLGFTHEEPITHMMTRFIQSYRDLPLLAYQFQKKFRNETRAKSGIMRTREFVMKDLYSFCKSEAEQLEVYEKCKVAYVNIFNRLGIGEKTFVTFASGGVFSKYSHEFQTICDAGEDEIYICDRLRLAINKEVYNDEVLKDLGVDKDEVRVEKAVEVGNIFNLGTRFSDAMDLQYSDETGVKQKVWMGSYGIGPARVMGTIVEVLADDKGIIWPEAVAPFSVHIVSLHKEKGDDVYSCAENVYNELKANHVDVIWDDREAGAGEKFADSDLLGMPMRITISQKTIAEDSVELKERKSGNVELVKTNLFLEGYKKSC